MVFSFPVLCYHSKGKIKAEESPIDLSSSGESNFLSILTSGCFCLNSSSKKEI
jgi:hypothetical protein